jgi:hypothetical protein
MATYKQIINDVKAHSSKSIKTCWIAHVKELNGLPLKKAPNRHLPDKRVEPCPPHIRPLIEESMKRLRILNKDE